jgi:hypothetical protein
MKHSPLQQHASVMSNSYLVAGPAVQNTEQAQADADIGPALPRKPPCVIIGSELYAA